MSNPLQTNSVHTTDADRRFDALASKFSKRPFKGMGEELAEGGPDALIVAVGALRALSDSDKKKDNTKS
jgi:hypothetical protein